MALNFTLRQVATRMAPHRLPLASPSFARRTYAATSTDGSKQTPEIPKTKDDAAPEDRPPQPLKRGSSAFDIDTSASPLAQQLIEASHEGRSGEQSKTGAKAKGARSMSSIEKRRQNTTRLLSLLFLFGCGYFTANLGKEFKTPEELEKFKDAPGADSFFGRVKLRAKARWEHMNNPVFEKLLPDPLPFPYSRPYTLVVDLDDLLIHSEWSRDKGWRVAKRPGLDYFLGYLSQFYEIVIFTTQPFYTAGPVIEKLDPPRRMIAYTLFKESCKTVNGKLVKDISYLNRDPSKVIILDTDPDAAALHPENAIILPPWKGEKNDTDLAMMVPFFEAIHIYGIPDVRNTIKAYEGTHIPTEHAKRSKAHREHELAQNRATSERLGTFSIFGGMRSGATGSNKTFFEQRSEEFHRAYAEDQKYWRENGEEFMRQAKEEQERQIKEMKLNAWSLLSSMGLPPPGTTDEKEKQ